MNNIKPPINSTPSYLVLSQRVVFPEHGDGHTSMVLLGNNEITRLHEICETLLIPIEEVPLSKSSGFVWCTQLSHNNGSVECS